MDIVHKGHSDIDLRKKQIMILALWAKIDLGQKKERKKENWSNFFMYFVYPI